MDKYIKTPYTKEQLRASMNSFRSNNHFHGTWQINGKKAMDKHGRIFLSFIKNSTNRELNFLRGLLKQGDTGFENLNRPFRMDIAKPFNPKCKDDAFTSLMKCGEVLALQRLITRTDIVSPRREADLLRQAHKVKCAIDKKPFKPANPTGLASVKDTASLIGKMATAGRTAPAKPKPAQSAKPAPAKAQGKPAPTAAKPTPKAKAGQSAKPAPVAKPKPAQKPKVKSQPKPQAGKPKPAPAKAKPKADEKKPTPNWNPIGDKKDCDSTPTPPPANPTPPPTPVQKLIRWIRGE